MTMKHQLEIKSCPRCGRLVFELIGADGAIWTFEAAIRRSLFQVGSKVEPAHALMQHIGAVCVPGEGVADA